MSDYIVTARKWRPMKFEEVAAQDHVTVTLRNALTSNRIAHAYLFAGPRGVGKTTTARLLAKALNCLHPQNAEPDNTCELCKEITEGRSFDVLEIDGASNRGVDEIRNLRESVRYAPAKARYKVFIIDEVHMLTKEAFNALLKTLEEPPSHVVFIFATTEVHKIPPTILSRCQRFDFRRIALEEIMRNLRGIADEEEIRITDDALLLIAKKGDGSLRDAQSIFDQAIAVCGKDISQEQIQQTLNVVDQELFFRVTDLIRARDAKGGLDLVQEIIRRGYDIKEFLAGLTEHFRNMLTAITTESTAYIEESDLYKKRYAELVKSFTTPDILRLLRLVTTTESTIRWSAQPRFKLETDIVQMILSHNAPEVGELIQRIDDLKKKLQNGSFLTGVVSQSPQVVSEPSRGNNGKMHPGYNSSPAPAARKADDAIPLEEAVESTPSKVLSEGEVQSRWPEFIGEVRHQRISLGSVLESATVLAVSGSVIRIACGNEFQASSVKRNKELLAQIVHSIFNVHGTIEVELVKDLPREPGKGDASPLQEAANENPIIQALIRELGAEPM